MLKIRKKRLVVSALVTTGLVVPAAAFAVGNLAKTNDSYAETYGTMEEAMANSGDQSPGAIKIADVNLWGCIVRGYASAKGTTPDYYSSLTTAQLAEITELDCGAGGSEYKVTAVNGIAQLPNLKTINLSNQAFPSINLQVFTQLEELNLSSNATLHTVSDGAVQNQGNVYINPTNKTKLNTLYLSNVPNIKKITAKNIPTLSTINFNNNSGLEWLEITGISEGSGGLDLSNDTSLETLLANNIGIERIRLPNTSSLDQVGLYHNNLSSIELPANCGITSLNLRDNPRLSEITNLTKCEDLESLAIINDNFSSIDISGNPNLVALKAKGNTELKSVNITNNKKLKNIQLGTSSSSDEYYIDMEAYDAEVNSGVVTVDFSDYSFINNNTAFASSSNYTASGAELTITNWNALESTSDGIKYVHVKQTSTPVADTNDANNGPLTFVNNYYRVLMPSLDVPEPQEYTITYDLKGGSASFTNPQTCTEGTTCKTPTAAPTKADSNFKGWSKTDGGSKAYGQGDTITDGTSITLYAIWEDATPEPSTYTVTYDLKGGTGSFPVQTCTVGATCKTPEYAPTMDNYTFKGWDTQSTATNPVYEQGSAISGSSNIILYAVWMPDSADTKKFTVSFDANEGKGAPEAVNCKTTDASCKVYIPKDEVPTRDGYTFLGWDKEKDAEKATYKPGDAIELDGNTTLYAIWQRIGSEKDAGIAAPNTGGNSEGGNNGIVAVLTATPIIALSALIGAKLYRGRKSHIKLD